MATNKSATPCEVCGQPTRSAEGVCQRTRDCRRERQRRWEAAHPGNNRERTRRSHKANPERTRDSKRRYYAAHREYVLFYQTLYRTSNHTEINARRRAKRAANLDLYRERGMYQKHGLSPAQWAELYESQEGRCYLCGRELDTVTPKAIAIDHDHRCCPMNKSCTICRRGMACISCNLAIGMVHDNPARLRRIADALEAAQAMVDKRKANTGEDMTLF